MAPAATDEDNKLDFVPGISFLPWEWTSLGAALTTKAGGLQQSLAGRCRFVVRQGFDPIDSSPTGRVVDGTADAGITVRHKNTAATLTVSNLAMRAGLDDPAAAAVASPSGDANVPSFKATLAKEYSDDAYMAFSFDFKKRKPELSVCWSGQTFTERSTVCVHVDPLWRTLRLGAAVALPGPEWRDTVYDEDKEMIEEPRDDGARHQLWLQHEARQGNWMHSTRMGARIDLGRAINWACDFIDYRVEPLLPPMFWALPGSRLLYKTLVPPEDSEQVRHRIKGWELDVSHDFSREAPLLALRKRMRYATLSASYDVQDQECGLEYSRAGVRLAARLARLDGEQGWKNPSLMLFVEPLSLLSK